MKKIAVVLTAACAAAALGCESMGTAAQSKTVQGATLGGLLGAGTGAIIGNQTDHAGAGTTIGAGLGALGGGLLGKALEERDQRSQQQQYPPAATPAPVTTAQTKFCPVGGEIYPESVKYCPNHGVELKYKE